MNYRIIVAISFIIGISGALIAQNSMNYELEFTADTARVETENRTLLDKDPSTMGMVQATIEYENQYDALLNKYYKILYRSLNEDGKKALKKSQLNWIKFRDSERELISEINSQAYEESGGGTFWGVLHISTAVELTKKRVFEIYNYLMYGYLGV